MDSDKFSESRQPGGRHYGLAQLAGNWEGMTRVWFEPGPPVDEAPIRGSIRVVLGGRFVIHEYATHFMGKPQEGLAIYGWHIDRGRYEAAWIDSGHTGTQLMFSEGVAGDDRFSMLGHYGGHDGSEPWGWRTEITPDGDDRLVITAWNIQPGEPEAKAVEIVYQRVKA